MATGNRIFEFDFFKGIAIILMVMGHVIQQNWEGALGHHPVYTWIYSFHMPLFFFISGFLINYTMGNKSISKALWKKSLSLLVPYFIGIYVITPFLSKESLPSFFHIITETDTRYWFVYILFVFSVLYYVGQLISRGLKGIWLSVGIGCLFFVSVQYFFPCELVKRGLGFYPMYLLGVISSAYKLNEREKLYKEPIMSILFIVFVVCSLSYCQVVDGYLNKVCKFVASFAVCYIVLYYINGSFIYSENKIVKWLTYIGNNSIVIYLTHLFFWRLLPKPIFSDFTPTSFWSFVISLTMSIIMIMACLFIGKIIERFKWINRLVYGRGWNIK